MSGSSSLGAGDRRLTAYKRYVRGLINLGRGFQGRALSDFRAAHAIFAAIGYTRLAMISQQAIDEITGPERRALTAAEERVAQRLRNGISSAVDIANELQITPKTVRNVVCSIMRKYGVRNRHELVASLQAS